jgi:hypothetical protein
MQHNLKRREYMRFFRLTHGSSTYSNCVRCLFSEPVLTFVYAAQDTGGSDR